LKGEKRREQEVSGVKLRKSGQPDEGKAEGVQVKRNGEDLTHTKKTKALEKKPRLFKGKEHSFTKTKKKETKNSEYISWQLRYPEVHRRIRERRERWGKRWG